MSVISFCHRGRCSEHSNLFLAIWADECKCLVHRTPAYVTNFSSLIEIGRIHANFKGGCRLGEPVAMTITDPVAAFVFF